MYRQQSGNNNTRMDNWLAYTPLLYKCLIFNRAPQLNSINTAKWLRGIVGNKSSFKFQEGIVCVAGSTSRGTKMGGFQGGLCVYKCLMPIGDQMDDDRLKPNIKLRSFWPFQEEINIVQQYTNNLIDKQRNHMFAISYKKSPIVNLMSARKVLQEGMHTSYGENQSIKLEGHKQQITSIKWANFMSSGHKILTSSEDCTIMEWDVQKIKVDRHLKYHRSSVQDLCPLYNYSPIWNDGHVIANQMSSIASVSTDGNIFIWDSKSATPANKINSKVKQLTSIDCLSEHCIITGGIDGSIKLWDLRNHRDYLYDNKLDRSQGHQGRVKQIKIKRKSQKQKQQTNQKNKNTWLGDIKFSSSGDDGKIIQWEQKLQFVHLGHQNPASFDILDQSSLCVSAQTKKNVFMIWQSGVSIGNQH